MQNQSVLTGKVLVLNQSYEPICVTSPRKAMILIYLLKAEVIEAHQNRYIRSVNQRFPFPSVIRLGRYINIPYKKIELSRKNILRRDNNKCQYCGKKLPNLTIDHVLPKSRGGGDTWENLVAACVKCNNIKGNRTPDEAGMKLLTQPKRPNHIMFIKHYIGNYENSWKQFLFMD